MALPEVGLQAVIEGMPQFERGAKAITTAYSNIDAGSNMVVKSSQSLGKSFLGLGDNLISFGTKAAVIATTAVTGIGAGLIYLGSKALSAGSDVAEMQSKFNIVFGEAAPQAIAALDEFGATVGRNKYELRGLAAGIQDTFVPLGFARDKAADMSIAMVKLSTDLGSFNNIPTADVMRDIQSAIVGNHETVRKYGVIITEATIKEELMKMGAEDLTGAALEQAKVQARLNLIINGTTDAQGDAARTAGEWANTMRALQSMIEETWAEIGLKLLPVMQPLLQMLNQLVRSILPPLVDLFSKKVVPVLQEMAETIKRLITGELDLTSLVPPELLQALNELWQAFKNLGNVILGDASKSASSFAETMRGMVGPTIEFLANTVIPALIKAIQFVVDHWEEFKGALMGVAAVLGGAVIASAIVAIGSAIAALATPITAIIAIAAVLGAAWQGNWFGIRDAVTEVWEKYLQPAFKELVKWLQKEIPKAVKVLQKWFKLIYDKVMPELQEVFEIFQKWVVKNWPLIQKVIAKVIDFLNDLIKKFTKDTSAFWDKWGDKIMAITEFVWKYIWKNIKTALKNILDIITLTLQIITGDWEGAWETIQRILDRTLKQMLDNIKSIFKAIESVIEKTWKEIVQIISNKAREAYNAVVNEFNKFASYISGLASSLYNAAIQMMQGIVNGINATLSTVRTTLINVITSAVNSLLSTVASGSIASLLRSIGQKMIEVIANAFTTVTTLANSLRAALSGAVQSVVNNLGDLATTLVNLGISMIARIGSGIVSTWTTLRTFLQSALTGAVGAVWSGASSLINSIKNIGSTIISYIGSAISSNFYNIKNKLRDVVKELVKEALDWLGIGSPSSLMYDMGISMAQGLALGLQAGRPLISASLGAVAAPASVAAPVGAMGGTTNNYYSYHLGGNNINNGMDAATFEARVLNVIRRNL